MIVRPGIYLEYKRGKDVFEELDWLFDEIKQKGIGARKTLLYVRYWVHINIHMYNIFIPLPNFTIAKEETFCFLVPKIPIYNA